MMLACILVTPPRPLFPSLPRDTLSKLPDYIRVSIRSGMFSSALDMMRLR
jgi:hypothetical protein